MIFSLPKDVQPPHSPSALRMLTGIKAPPLSTLVELLGFIPPPRPPTNLPLVGVCGVGGGGGGQVWQFKSWVGKILNSQMSRFFPCLYGAPSVVDTVCTGAEAPFCCVASLVHCPIASLPLCTTTPTTTYPTYYLLLAFHLHLVRGWRRQPCDLVVWLGLVWTLYLRADVSRLSYKQHTLHHPLPPAHFFTRILSP